MDLLINGLIGSGSQILEDTMAMTHKLQLVHAALGFNDALKAPNIVLILFLLVSCHLNKGERTLTLRAFLLILARRNCSNNYRTMLFILYLLSGTFTEGLFSFMLSGL